MLDPIPEWERMTRTLAKRLHADESVSAYVLVDRMLRDPFPADWLLEQGCEVVSLPVQHPLLEDAQRPCLIHLRPSDVRLLEAGVVMALSEQQEPETEREQGFSMGGWLLSQAPAQALASHLAQRMQGFGTPAPKGKLIRWFDRRVMECMWPVLTQAQRANLLGPVLHWYSIDRRNEYVIYSRPTIEAAAPLVFTGAQRRHAQDNEAVQDLLRGWQSIASRLPLDYPAQAAHAVRAAAELGGEWGLDNRQDRVLLGIYILQVHPQITSHPALIAAVRRVRDEGLTLTEALSEIPDPEGWDSMRTDLQHGSTFSPNAPSKQGTSSWS